MAEPMTEPTTAFTTEQMVPNTEPMVVLTTEPATEPTTEPTIEPTLVPTAGVQKNTGARSAPIPAGGFAVITSKGQTCASAGLVAITSAQECEQAISAVNTAYSKRGLGSVKTENNSHKPSGCYARCNQASFGYFCSYFNTATAVHDVPN